MRVFGGELVRQECVWRRRARECERGEAARWKARRIHSHSKQDAGHCPKLGGQDHIETKGMNGWEWNGLG